MSLYTLSPDHLSLLWGSGFCEWTTKASRRSLEQHRQSGMEKSPELLIARSWPARTTTATVTTRFHYQPSPPKGRKFSNEEVLARFMISTDAKFDAVNATLRDVQASIQNLENQVRQLAKANSKQPHGSLPSNTEANLRKQLQSITLRSGREVEVWPENKPAVEKSKHVAGDAISEDEVVIEE